MTYVKHKDLGEIDANLSPYATTNFIQGKRNE